jgi:hypothetical protein
MCLIINDVFLFGYDSDTRKGRNKIGFRKFPDKEEFLEKLKNINKDFYDFVTTKDFQEWLDVLGQLRHKNAHREMISPSPLLQPTKESEINDAEIDAIIYKDRPPMEEEVARMIPQLIETQKALDRHHYKISKMDKLYDHVAIVKGGFLDPVARINIDMENIKRLTNFLLETYDKNPL